MPDELDSHLVQIQFILLGHLVQECVAGFAEHVAVLAHLDALQPIMYRRLFAVYSIWGDLERVTPYFNYVLNQRLPEQLMDELPNPKFTFFHVKHLAQAPVLKRGKWQLRSGSNAKRPIRPVLIPVSVA